MMDYLREKLAKFSVKCSRIFAEKGSLTEPSLKKQRLKLKEKSQRKCLRLSKVAVKRLEVPSFITSGVIFKECDYYGSIEPIAGVDGWYYDRHSRSDWYEYDGKAYRDRRGSNGSQWLWEFAQLDTKWLSTEEVQAIKTLQIHKICPKDLSEMLYRHKHNIQLRDIYRGRFGVMKRFKAFCQKIQDRKAGEQSEP